MNSPTLPKETADKIQPYLQVANKLGKLLAQLEPVDVREVRITCTGEAGELGVRPIAHAALAGFLDRFVDGGVTAISAPFEAQERGISIVEVREQATRGFASTVRVTISGDKGIHTATGTLSASGEPRLVGLDGYELDAILQGTTLVMHNDDRPGVIGAVGTILGNRKINVSRMQVGLDESTRQALALWNVDSVVPPDALEELRKLALVRSVLVVSV